MTTKTLLGKVAIVTGSSRGIGRAIAERLARDGARIVINYASSEAKAQQVRQSIEQAGGQALLVRADVSRTNEITALFQQTLTEWGRIDIFVANAGVPSREAFTQVTEDHYDQVFAINTKGVFFALQEAARHVSDGGRILNISSGQTIHPAENFALYAGSKAAAKLFVQVLAQEIGYRGVTVNNLIAGPVDVGFLENAEAGYKTTMAQASALKRLATAEDIADAVALLVSGDARFITGQDIVVDGGATHF